ncbi:hypothetical protein NLJ89_g9598 [Agrocybe chaxingu]|uniref:ATP-dependent DNA ligase family profile domain-containing protein n=1 Tax=Agrocybe chaxingu TaxID=84603 RepID=A0A9W8JT98_9AGAR|nr:hypothetical protein NLJ89_g9598 [Agrocybe chaxingu]
MSPASHEATGVDFSYFSALVRQISRIQPHSSKARPERPANYLDYPAARVLHQWVERLRRQYSPLPPNITGICFRLLFPEDDIRRKYEIQEARMTKLLLNCYGLDARKFDENSLNEASACLGQELRVVLERTCPNDDGFIAPLTLVQIDELLDELAAISAFSDKSIRSKYLKPRRSRAEIIRSLFRGLSPEDASVLTQIVLKDLRPLMYPLTEFHYGTALTKFNVAAVKMIIKEHAMDIWDPSGVFLRFYRVHASLDEVTAFMDKPPSERTHRDFAPNIGSPVAIPKSEKGRSCQHALDYLEGSQTVWAETKYDGERAQIHVTVDTDGSSHITIFSKSKRDSTLDRHAVHSVIRSALGLDTPNYRRDSGKRQVKKNAILDAEMVAFRGDFVEDFWRIRQLIEDTAYGVRGSRKWTYSKKVEEERESINSEANEGLSLGLVFFDVIILDSESLLFESYASRRRLLENLIEVVPGKAILADRYPVDMVQSPLQTLQTIFNEHVSACQEGIVLKADDSRYNDYRKPWVKLKKDYMLDKGDSLDLVVLGASWEKEVPPSTYTTFYVGGVERPERKLPSPSGVPRFHAYFTVSYGLTRAELEEVNFLIKSSETVSYASLNAAKLPFDLTVSQGLNPAPTVILRTPLLVNLYGAGFTKAHQSAHYELRFPRITKVFRPSERSWREALDLETVHKTALRSVGRDSSDKDLLDWAKQAFGKTCSPSVNCGMKRKAMMEKWGEQPGRKSLKSPRFEKPATQTSKSRSENSSTQVVIRTSTPDKTPLGVRTNVIDLSTPVRSRPPQLKAPPTPSSPLVERQSAKARRAEKDPVPESLDNLVKNSWVWVAKCHRPCTSMQAWKKRIPKQQQLRSLEAVMAGCGWTGPGIEDASWVHQGVIILDECNESRWKEHIVSTAEQAEKRTNRRPLLVFACSSTEPLLRLV